MYRIAISFLALVYITAEKEGVPAFLPPNQLCAWDSTSNWRIYKLNDFRRVFAVPPDSMRHLESVSINDDSIRQMLCTSENIAIENPLWMGCYLASYQTSQGDMEKVIISQYGGFFFIPKKKAYFQIEGTKRTDWLTYLSKSYVKMED